jgi:ABC-type glycerol-3-phosphate transport system permease component
VPAKFIIDNLLVRANIGLASAASTVLLLTVLAMLAPWFYVRAHAALRAGCARPARRSGRRPAAVHASPGAHRHVRLPLHRGGRLPAAALRDAGHLVKPMEEIRLGNLFSLPVRITLAPWAQAWASACTGLDCGGIRTGFMNSVAIVVPSTVLSILLGA